MSRMQVQITWTKPQSARREQVPSPLIFLTLSEDISGRRDITTIALGSWVLGVADFLKDHCLIPATILKFPRFQQRLGLELALAFASAPKGGIDITFGTLLERAGIAIDTHTPQNTIYAVMQALSKLAEQKIIDDSPYPSLVEGSREVYFFRWLGSSTADIRAQQEVVEHHLVRKWWEHLLNQRVHFTPPRVASNSVPFVRGKSEASFP